MERFINDDVVLIPGSRIAAKIDEWDLELLMLRLCAEDELSYEAFYNLLYEDLLPDGDNEYHLGADHVHCDPTNYELFYGEGDIGNPLIGLHTLENGLTFFGIVAGGDGQNCAFCVFYWDGKQVRMYTPKYGNYVNLDFAVVLGNEGWGDIEVDEQQLETEYRKLGIWEDDSSFEELYFRKYGFMTWQEQRNAAFNWDALKKDLLTTFKVA